MHGMDTWKVVDFLVSNFGTDAEQVAAQLAESQFDRGDASRFAAWIRVTRALDHFRAERPAFGETVH